MLLVVARWCDESDFARAWNVSPLLMKMCAQLITLKNRGAEEPIAYCTIARTRAGFTGMRKSTWAEGPGELRRRAGAPRRASHLPTLGHANGVDLLISQPEVAWRIKEAAS
jgi:hypothetical protein